MSRRSISYTKGYEHSDFADLLSELRGESENTAMVDGALALAIPSPVVTVSANEESEDRHRITSNQKIKYLYSRKENIIHDKHCSCAKYMSLFGGSFCATWKMKYPALSYVNRK